MLLQIFCVFDSKARNYGMPFFTQNRGTAIRGIQLQLQQDGNSMLAKYPSDFDLFHVGNFDDESGLFTCPETSNPIFIINVSELIGGSDEQQPQR
jgi:hypothetical protein